MFRLFVFLLIATLFRVVITEPILERRNNCGCPQFDAAGFPLAPSSGRVGNQFHCIYIDTDRCLYDPNTGVLRTDQDFGLCPPNAPWGNCPPTDRGGYCLGPGSTELQSGLFNSPTLVCTYPTASEVADTSFFCDYSNSGALITDRDTGFCPSWADCPCLPPVTTQRATCTVTPTVTPPRTTTARPYTTYY